jgi:uncharacterized glyoxalase superfamily protein PhnB
MLVACSHLLLVSGDVERTMAFLGDAFGLVPRFRNPEFGEFVLESGFRLAVFRPTGTAARHFAVPRERTGVAIGVTVRDVDGFFRALAPRLAALGATVSGPPREHPWGEKSFLLVDPDGNRWEIAQSPTPSGMLRDLPAAPA